MKKKEKRVKTNLDKFTKLNSDELRQVKGGCISLALFTGKGIS